MALITAQISLCILRHNLTLQHNPLDVLRSRSTIWYQPCFPTCHFCPWGNIRPQWILQCSVAPHHKARLGPLQQTHAIYFRTCTASSERGGTQSSSHGRQCGWRGYWKVAFPIFSMMIIQGLFYFLLTLVCNIYPTALWINFL